MLQVDWNEDQDEDGDFTATLTIISSDPALIRKARRMMRSLLDDSPNLTAVPRTASDDESGECPWTVKQSATKTAESIYRQVAKLK